MMRSIKPPPKVKNNEIQQFDLYKDSEFEEAVRREMLLIEKALRESDQALTSQSQVQNQAQSVDFHPPVAQTRDHGMKSSPVRRVGGGIKSLYDNPDAVAKNAAIKAAYSRMLQQQIDEKNSRNVVRSNQHRAAEDYAGLLLPSFQSPDRRESAPAVDKWKPSGNYIDDRERSKRAAMRATLEAQLNEDIQRKKEQKELEKLEERKLEEKIRLAVEAEEESKSRANIEKKRMLEEKIRKAAQLQEFVVQQDRSEIKNREAPDAVAKVSIKDSVPIEYNDLATVIPSEESQFRSPMLSSRSHVSNNSPGKPARARLISDVYGSAGIIGSNNNYQQPLTDNWRPSGKNVNEKTRAAQLEMKAMLDQQRLEHLRRKEEEKRREEEEEKRMVEKLRQLDIEEANRRRQEEDAKRQLALQQQRAVEALLEAQRQEALNRKGKRHSEVTVPVNSKPENTDRELEQGHGNRDRLSAESAKKPLNRQTASPDNRHRSDFRYESQGNNHRYEHQDIGERDSQPLVREDYQQSKMQEVQRLQSIGHPNMEIYQRSFERESYDSYSSMNGGRQYRESLNRRSMTRPDTADEVDAMLYDWQKKQISSMSNQYDPNNVSFVGDSRFLNASSSFKALDNHSVHRSNRKRTDYPIDGEKSLDSESFFYYYGERPSLLNQSPSVDERLDISVHKGITTTIQNSQRQSKPLTDEVKVAWSADVDNDTNASLVLSGSGRLTSLSDLINSTNHFIEQEIKRNTSVETNLSQHRPFLSQRSAVTAAEVITPSTGRSSVPSSAGDINRRDHLRMKHVNVNNFGSDDNQRGRYNEEWIGEDEIMVIPHRKSVVPSPLNNNENVHMKPSLQVNAGTLSRVSSFADQDSPDSSRYSQSPQEPLKRRGESDGAIVSPVRAVSAKSTLEDMGTIIRPLSARHASSLVGTMINDMQSPRTPTVLLNNGRGLSGLSVVSTEPPKSSKSTVSVKSSSRTGTAGKSYNEYDGYSDDDFET